jgi:hypothetical protein
MCGGGGRRATIEKPDYNAYNQQFELQKSAIEQSMNSGIRELQADYQSQLRQNTASMQAIEQERIADARDEALIAEDARRLATLIGTPPPEKVAQSPKIGTKSRELATANGKKSLRIGSSASSSAKGTGLNIT